MKTALVIVVVLVMLIGMVGPSEAWGRGGHPHGFRGCCWGWWWPGAIVGGLALGALAVATAPIAAIAAPFYAAPPPAYAAPPPAYSTPSMVYQPAPARMPAATYAARSAPSVQREVVFPNGRYVLYGDGMSQPWQWVWMPAAPPAPPPPPR